MTTGATLAQLAGMVAAGDATAEALVERAYERIVRLNDGLNAVVELRDADAAMAEARSMDERARRGERCGSLAGIPFLAKDSHDVVGLRTTQGSLLLADTEPAMCDCLHIARLRAAGAIPIGKTNVPEFCFEAFTANRLFGATRNPWAPEWSPGGSSGGSAAAMAAGMVPFATAADGGGSIRIPASFCGLFGLKPTCGIIGRDPVPDWIDFVTDGPLAASMADLRLLLAVEAGPASGDPTSLATEVVRRLVGKSGDTPGRPSLVLVAPRFVDWGPLPSAVAGLFDAAVASLEGDLGCRVERIATERIFGGSNAQKDWLVAVSSESANAMGRATIEAEAERMDSAALAALRIGLGVTIEDYLGARRRRAHYVRALDDLLGTNRVIVTPTLPVEGILADGREVGADEPGTSFSSFNTQVANLTGHPALTVPAGLMPNGIPFGLQIVGPRFADRLVMDLGQLWEQTHPGARVAPGFEPFWPAE